MSASTIEKLRALPRRWSRRAPRLRLVREQIHPSRRASTPSISPDPAQRRCRPAGPQELCTRRASCRDQSAAARQRHRAAGSFRTFLLHGRDCQSARRRYQAGVRARIRSAEQSKNGDPCHWSFVARSAPARTRIAPPSAFARTRRTALCRSERRREYSRA